jgi:hypothetical protein
MTKELSDYDFVIEHIKWKENGIADADIQDIWKKSN